jgi:hypothetical protein
MTLSTLRYMGFLPGDPGYLTGHNPRQITSTSCDECGAQVSLTGVTRGLATCTDTECNSTEAKLRREVADLHHLLSVATEVARERAETIARLTRDHEPARASGATYFSDRGYQPAPHMIPDAERRRRFAQEQ